MKNIFLSLTLVGLFVGLVACTTTQKVEPTVEAKPEAVQKEIDSLQTQIASLDALIDNARTHLEGYSLEDMAKWDLAMTKAEAEFETYKTERNKLEARLAELQPEFAEPTELE